VLENELPLNFSVSVLTDIFLGEPGLVGFNESKDDGGGGDIWNYKSCKVPVKSSPPTNQHPVFFTGLMPFLPPNQQCQSTEGRISHSKDLLTPNSYGGLPTLSLTTNSSWLPWGGFHASRQPSNASTPELPLNLLNIYLASILDWTLKLIVAVTSAVNAPILGADDVMIHLVICPSVALLLFLYCSVCHSSLACPWVEWHH